ncbi:MAG: histidinol-phosphatase [Bacteroidia bacterium]|nr:histidinol-phosphatase [Bacteroidia bacterium]
MITSTTSRNVIEASANSSILPGFLPLLHALADASAVWIMRHFRTDFATERKADSSPVTEADRGAERIMREMILASHPDHGIIGEEYGSLRPEARWTWVLDPIDGTKSFISGVPLFGTLIAVCEYGQPLLGCINFPVLHQRLIGDNRNAWLNGSRISVRPIHALEDATLLVTDPSDIRRHKNGVAFERLTERVGIFRSWGDCYGHALLASGYADIMVDPVLQPWDIMALLPVLRGAGAAVSSYEGGDAVASGSLVASHPALHDEVIAMLNND